LTLDSSAIIAILLREPGHEALLGHLAGAEAPAVGAPTLAETGIVLTARLEHRGRIQQERFLKESECTVIGFEEAHYGVAVDAFGRFGKGRHPAALNFGDCLTYAVAKLSGEPLLAIGDDFRQTDLALVG
jgi:ribonuclease VapC